MNARRACAVWCVAAVVLVGCAAATLPRAASEDAASEDTASEDAASEDTPSEDTPSEDAASENASLATLRGLTVAPENRCSVYDRGDYRYSQSIEDDIVAQLGAIYGPYTKTCFASTSQTDIEHMVATSEAHDSGLCAQDDATRKRFASDLRNLTLAAPSVNRGQKSGKDAAEWLPTHNKCWFAARVVEVRRAYGLTIDQAEARALEKILAGCASTAMEPMVCLLREPKPDPGRRDRGPLVRYDDNGDGRITCAEARRHGIAPVPRAHPAYRYMRDADNDGTVCE